MSATTHATDDDPLQANPGAGDDAAVDHGESLVKASGAGDECAVCGSGMAPDQRYCVECGTRRGKPRFTLQQSDPVEPEPERGRRTGRAGLSTGTVLAGIATLLLALGVGVLIGKSVATTPKATNVHVFVNGVGGSSSGAATSTPSSSSTAGGSSGTGTSASGGSNTPSGSKKATTSGGSSASSCTAGTPGCKAGKQTGNFFGG